MRWFTELVNENVIERVYLNLDWGGVDAYFAYWDEWYILIKVLIEYINSTSLISSAFPAAAVRWGKRSHPSHLFSVSEYVYMGDLAVSY